MLQEQTSLAASHSVKPEKSVSLLQKRSLDTCLGTLMCLQRCSRTEETNGAHAVLTLAAVCHTKHSWNSTSKQQSLCQAGQCLTQTMIWVICHFSIMLATGPEAGQTWGSCWWEQRPGRKLCALPHLKARIPSGRCSCHSTLARHTSTYHRQTLYFRSNSLCSHTFTKLCQGTARGLQPEQKQYSLCLGTGVFLLFAELYAVRKPHLLQNLYQILSLSSFLMFQLINFTDFIFLLGRRNSFKVNEGQCIFLLQLITCSLACD